MLFLELRLNFEHNEHAARACDSFEEQSTRIRFVSIVGALVVAGPPRGVTVTPSICRLITAVCALYGADSGLKKDDIVEVN